MNQREAVAVLEDVRYPLQKKMNNATEAALRALRASYWWTPDKRLPLVNVPVLILREGGTVCEAWMASVRYDGAPVWMSPAGCLLDTVTAWREMPTAEEAEAGL